jgi:hypothetical protein
MDDIETQGIRQRTIHNMDDIETQGIRQRTIHNTENKLKYEQHGPH